MNSARISLHIERLVLHGFTSTDKARIGTALQNELQRLLVNGMPGDGLTPAVIGRVDAGSIAAGSSGTPEMVGTHVAHRVAAQLGVGAVVPGAVSAPRSPVGQGGRR